MKQLPCLQVFPVVTKDKTILIEGPRRFFKSLQSLGHPQEEAIEEKVQVTSFLIVFWHTVCLWSLKTFLPLWFSGLNALEKGGLGYHQFKSPRDPAHKLSQPRVCYGLGEWEWSVQKSIRCSAAPKVTTWECVELSDILILSLEVPRSWFFVWIYKL